MEKTYIINYFYPTFYKGTYVVRAEDSEKANKKVMEYLVKKFGEEKDSHSMIMEVNDNRMIFCKKLK